MKNNVKLLHVIDVTVDIKSDFISYARLWVDESRFFSYGFGGDRIYAWNDSNIPHDEKDFSKAYDIFRQLEALKYRISSFQIRKIKGDIDAGYRLKRCHNKQDTVFVDDTSIETLIELWYYLNKSIPLLISETLLRTEEDSIRRKFPDLEIWELEKLSEALIEDIKYIKMGLGPPEETQDKKKSLVLEKYSIDEVGSYSEQKCNKYLELLLKNEDYETATTLREVMKKRNLKITVEGFTKIRYLDRILFGDAVYFFIKTHVLNSSLLPSTHH